MSFVSKLSTHIDDELAPDTTLEEAQHNFNEFLANDWKDAVALPGPQVKEALGNPFSFWKSPSGLSPKHVHKCVNMTLEAAVLGYHKRANMHYTEGGSRWSGIDQNRKAWRKEYPIYADCSAYVTWCLWNGLDHFHHRDTVNGEHWRAGYTGTLAMHGRRVTKLRPGDIVLYGWGAPWKHTAIYTGGGLVVSFGSEAGPLLLPYNYRSDVGQFRRYI